MSGNINISGLEPIDDPEYRWGKKENELLSRSSSDTLYIQMIAKTTATD